MWAYVLLLVFLFKQWVIVTTCFSTQESLFHILNLILMFLSTGFFPGNDYLFSTGTVDSEPIDFSAVKLIQPFILLSLKIA